MENVPAKESGRKPKGPRLNPMGWHDLHWAFNFYAYSAIGKVMLGSPDIVGMADTAQSSPLFATDDLSAFDPPVHLYCKMYAEMLCSSFGSALRSGRLRAGYGHKAGGGVTQMEPELWYTSDPALRYRHFDFNPDDPFADAPDQPCWLFVHADDYEKLYHDIKAWRAQFSTYQGQAIPDDGLDCLDRNGAPIFVKELDAPARPRFLLGSSRFPNFEKADPIPRARGVPVLRVVGGTDTEPKRRKTKDKPLWYPKLRDEYRARFERDSKFHLEGKTPPRFPNDKQLRAKVAERLGIEAETMPLSTFSYHRRALDVEFGR